MSVIEEVMLEEYERSIRIEKAILIEQEQLPKGSIQIKNIANKQYNYLMYRENNKVISRYIKPEELDSLKKQIQKRKENQAALKELRKSKKQIIRALGKEYIDEHTK